MILTSRPASRGAAEVSYFPMVSIDTPQLGNSPIQPSIRPYSSEDFAWAVQLLDGTGGRHRVRRGKVVDLAMLPGLIAERNGQPTALLALSRRGDELEFAVLAAAPFDDVLVGMLIAAAKTYTSPTCRRIYTICSNADFDVQRALQQHGFRLCTSRPGAIEAVARRSTVPLVRTFAGIVVRDELEFDQLLP